MLKSGSYVSSKKANTNILGFKSQYYVKIIIRNNLGQKCICFVHFKINKKNIPTMYSCL